MRLNELKNQSMLFSQLKAMKPKFVAIAQKIYDRWDGSDYRNGICDDISEKISAYVDRRKDSLHAIAVPYGRNKAGNHAYAVVFNKTEAFMIDIPYFKYEQSKMVNDPEYGKQQGWRKVPNAQFTEEDVRIHAIPRQKFMNWREHTRALKSLKESFKPIDINSAQFKAWFDNSVVRKRNGKPEIVYHRTAGNFLTFNTDNSDLGSHFGTSEQAENLLGGSFRIGEKTLPVYLSIQKPIRLLDKGGFHGDSVAPQLFKKGLIDKHTAKRLSEIGYNGDLKDRRKINKEIKNILLKNGYDGVVYKNTREGTGDSYIVFSPNQVKSAISNTGNFDKNSAKITEGTISYSDDGTIIAHGDIEYDINKIMKTIQQLPIQIISTEDVRWSLKNHKELDPKTIEDANLAHCIVVSNYKDGLLVVYGLPIVAKALATGTEAIKAKMISHKLLNKARVD